MSAPWVTIKTPSRLIEIAEDLGRINFDDLSGEVETVNTVSLWWATLAADSRRRLNLAKLDCDLLERNLAKAARAGAVARGERFTVDAIKDEVGSHPDVIALRRAIIDLEHDTEVLDATKFSLVRKATTVGEHFGGLVAQEVIARRGPADHGPFPPSPRVPRTPVPLKR